MLVSHTEVAFLAHIKISTHQTVKSSSFDRVRSTIVAKITSRSEALSSSQGILSSADIKFFGTF